MIHWTLNANKLVILCTQHMVDIRGSILCTGSAIQCISPSVFYQPSTLESQCVVQDPIGAPDAELDQPDASTGSGAPRWPPEVGQAGGHLRWGKEVGHLRWAKQVDLSSIYPVKRFTLISKW